MLRNSEVRGIQNGKSNNKTQTGYENIEISRSIEEKKTKVFYKTKVLSISILNSYRHIYKYLLVSKEAKFLIALSWHIILLTAFIKTS